MPSTPILPHATPPDVDVEALIHAGRWAQAQALLSVAGAVMICYDYLLTLDQEARFMWRRSSRRSGAALLYYTVRYPGLLGAAAAIYTSVLAPPISGAPSKATAVMLLIRTFSSFVVFIGAIVFSGLRLYAVSGRNIWILVGVLILGFLSPGIDLVAFGIYTHARVSPASQWATTVKWAIAERVCWVVADAVVLVLNWIYIRPLHAARVDTQRRNLGEVVLPSRWNGLRTAGTLSGVMVEDGSLYFGALLLVNIVALSLSRIPQLLTPLSIWSSGITCVLTSRFILDLQHANEVLAGGGTSARETGGGWGVNISMSALGNSRRRPVD